MVDVMDRDALLQLVLTTHAGWAQNSNTSRHLAEFWMLEPEVAFATKDDAVSTAAPVHAPLVALTCHACTVRRSTWRRCAFKGRCVTRSSSVGTMSTSSTSASTRTRWHVCMPLWSVRLLFLRRVFAASTTLNEVCFPTRRALRAHGVRSRCIYNCPFGRHCRG